MTRCASKLVFTILATLAWGTALLWPSFALALPPPLPQVVVPPSACPNCNIHVSQNSAGFHQHYFNTAPSAGFTANTNDYLYTWIYIDPDKAPSEVMVQWFSGATWYRAWFGPTDVISGGGGLHMSNTVPAPGTWFPIRVSKSSLMGSGASVISGLAFSLYNGSAYWGESGYQVGSSTAVENVWVGNQTPGVATMFATNADNWTWVPRFRRNWTQFGGNPQHTSGNDSESVLGVSNVNGSTMQVLQGFTPFPVATTTHVSPVVLTNVLWAVDNKVHDIIYDNNVGTLTAFDAYSGKKLGAVAGPSPSQFSPPPAIDPNLGFIYNFAGDGCVHKYSVSTLAEVGLYGASPSTCQSTQLSNFPAWVVGWGPPGRAAGDRGVEGALTTGVSLTQPYLFTAYQNQSGDLAVDGFGGSLTTINLNNGDQSVFNPMCSQWSMHGPVGPVNPCGTGGGMWAKGGPSYDIMSGYLYLTTGNASDANSSADFATHWPMALLGVQPGQPGFASYLFPETYGSSPVSYANASTSDGDLSTNVMVLANTGVYSQSHLGVIGGKDGVLRLYDFDLVTSGGSMNGEGSGTNAGAALSTIPVAAVAGCIGSLDGNDVCNMGPLATWVDPADHTSWVFANNQGATVGARVLPTVPASFSQTPGNYWSVPNAPAAMQIGGVFVANGVAYFGDGAGLHAVNAKTGASLWNTTTVKAKQWETPLVVNGVLYFAGHAFTNNGSMINEGGTYGTYNLAQGLGNSWSSSTLSGTWATPDLGNDGNTDPDYWDNSVFHTNDDANAYWYVDLLGARTVSQVVLYNRTDSALNRLGGFKILYWNGSSWSVASDQSNYVTSAVNPVVPISFAPIQAEFFMVQKTDTDYLHLAEVQVLGH